MTPFSFPSKRFLIVLSYGCSMGLFISHSSALHWWLRGTVDGNSISEPSRRVTVPMPTKEAMQEALGRFPDRPLHVLVPTPGARYASRSLRGHAWQASLPLGSAVRVGNCYVSTPEFLFLQAAFCMPFIQLIECGFELCALYTHRLRDYDYTELPCALTSAERIQTFLERCNGLRGVRAARLAVRWIKDRSRSVRETKFAISMTLPRAYGG